MSGPFLLIRNWNGKTQFSIDFGPRPGATVRREIDAGTSRKIAITDDQASMGLEYLESYFWLGGFQRAQG